MALPIYIILIIVVLAIVLTIFVTVHIIQRRKIAQLIEQNQQSEQQLQLATENIQAEISAHKATQTALQEEKIARIKVETE